MESTTMPPKCKLFYSRGRPTSKKLACFGKYLNRYLSGITGTGLSTIIGAMLVVGCSGNSNEPSPTQGSDAVESSGVIGASAVISLDQIKTQIAQGNRNGATKNLRNYLLQNPTDGKALEMAGDLASAQSSVDEAIAQYQMAVEVTETPSEPLLNKLAMEQMLSLIHI